MFLFDSPVPLRQRLTIATALAALRGRALLHRGGGTSDPGAVDVLLFTRAGDVLCATPMLSILRARFPEAYLRLIVYEEVAEVARGIAGVQEVLAVRKSTPREAVARMLELPEAPHAWVLTHSINPLAAAYLARRNYDAAAGYLWDRTYAWHRGEAVRLEPVRRPFGTLVEQHTAILEALRVPLGTVPAIAWQRDEGRIRAETRAFAESLGGRFVLVVPGSRSANRTWPAENFRALLERLRGSLSPGTKVAITGAANERALLEALARESGAALSGLDLSFSEFAFLIERSAVVVANDSAASHLAALYRTPDVILYGPVAPELRDHRMPGHAHRALVGAERCRCGMDFFSERPCPHARVCLRSISVDSVAAAVSAALVDSASGRD